MSDKQGYAHLTAEIAELKEELADKRKFCYAVECALDGLKGDYVEIIKGLRKEKDGNGLLGRRTMDNPVAWMVTYGELTNIVYTQPTQVVDTHYQPLYAAPPQRKWVGLTGDEIKYLPKGGTWWETIRAAETILKEKNGG